MELTLREFENLNLYSHKNMEKVIRKLVNESYNAALTSMFDDSLVLLDHTTGKFYTADYMFNESTLTLSLKNFEEVLLVKEESEFESDLGRFFEDEDMSPHELVESYKENIIEQEKYIDDLISEVVSTKNFANTVNYGKIKEAKDRLTLESANEDFFKTYKERLQTHPLTEIAYFDWKNPVNVSLMETESHLLINSSVVEKAKTMWKRNDFKNAFVESVKELQEGNDEKVLALFEDFPVLFHLAEEDRLAVFGKTLLSSSLREDRKGIVGKIENLLKEDDRFVELRETYIKEEGEEVVEPAAAVEKPEANLELTTEQVSKLVSDLKALHDSMEEGVEKKKLDDIVKKLETSKEEGTKPVDVKEAVNLLSL